MRSVDTRGKRAEAVFRIVSGTRASEANFVTATALGRSLWKFRSHPNLEVEIYFDNSRSLGDIYNQSIRNAEDNHAILVFLHDDVYLEDLRWTSKAGRALRKVDLVGVAGNRRRLPRQPNWAFVDAAFAWDEPRNLSGAVWYGEPPGTVSRFGPSRQDCKLLDGVMLISDSRTLHRHGLRFDPQFAFHFYDLDFCQQAEWRGLKMGTANIKLVHQSVGAFGSAAWLAAYERYLQKYGD